MNELLGGLNREQVKANLERVNPQESVSTSIADELSLTVFSQPEAMRAVGRRLAMMRAGLSPKDKPLGSLYFAGPSGVGKTETAFAIEKWIMGKNNSGRLKILNMGEYQESHYAARFFGSPPGYVDYDQPPAIPHEWLNGREPSIIVFDEFEKANPAIHKTMLSILDKASLDARDGRNGVQPLDFTNSLLIFTSNLAGQEVTNITEEKEKHIGFSQSTRTKDKHKDIKAAVDREMKKTYAPELLKRFDDVVVFQPLEGNEVYNALVTKFLGKLNDQWRDRLGTSAPYFDLTREARDYLISKVGHEGGRAMGKAFDQHILDGLADVLLSTDYTRRPFVADIEEGKTYWYTDVAREPQPELKKLTEGKKNLPTDPWFNLPEDNLEDGQGDSFPSEGDLPPEEEEEEEEEKEVKPKAKFTLFIPKEGDIFSTIDLSIVIHEKGRKDKMQLLEGIPLLDNKK